MTTSSPAQRRTRRLVGDTSMLQRHFVARRYAGGLRLGLYEHHRPRLWREWHALCAADR